MGIPLYVTTSARGRRWRSFAPVSNTRILLARSCDRTRCSPSLVVYKLPFSCLHFFLLPRQLAGKCPRSLSCPLPPSTSSRRGWQSSSLKRTGRTPLQERRWPWRTSLRSKVRPSIWHQSRAVPTFPFAVSALLSLLCCLWSPLSCRIA